MLYQIIIYPIEIIIEVLYYVFDKITGNKGVSIIGVSLAVQLLTLPLYTMAEKWQKDERLKQQYMKPKVDKIKAVFNGDEQYMILSTYYKQQHYNPLYTLRSSLSLLIQVPFFIAAYSFLTSLETTSTASFLFIQNLALPDNLLSVGSFTINVLPLIMTAVNILSSVIYTKGFSDREKIQLYAMALVFLVLLYASPSGLVLYWTMNNVFSLIKNIICKTKNPLKIFYLLASLASLLLLITVLFIINASKLEKTVILLASIFVVSTPLFFRVIKTIYKLVETSFTNKKVYTILFLSSCIGLFILSGAFIPSALIASSPQEFSFIGEYSSPLQLLNVTISQAAGFFLFWLMLLFFLFSDPIKHVLTLLSSSFFIFALLNTFIFTGDYGNISIALQFDKIIPLAPSLVSLLIDTGIYILILLSTIFAISLLKMNLLTAVSIIACTGLLALSIHNTITTQSIFLELKETIANSEKNASSISRDSSSGTVFNLSKDQKNVVIFMLDRAVSSFVPYIFEELPTTKKQFDGFTWYPNTLSVHTSTLIGVPPLYGGYEYLPHEINKRKDESLANKHNEALIMLPRLFLESGYSSKMTDAPWVNHKWITDNSIFHEWGIEAESLFEKYSAKWLLENNETSQNNILKERLLFVSFFRMAPQSLRGVINMEGYWWNVSNTSPSFAFFLDFFAQLDFLPEITSFSSEKPSFNFIENSTTHTPTFLQYPDYIPMNNVDNVGSNIWNDKITHMHYHVNAVSLKKLGEWFDFLRSHNVYDNTKIIIISDHAVKVANTKEFAVLESNGIDISAYNSMLLVKDFYSNEAIATNWDFMTTADLPILATEGAIENAINPFSGNHLKDTVSKDGFTLYSGDGFPESHSKNTFAINELYRINDNIFEPENWSKVK